MLTTSPIAVLGQAPPGFDDKSLQSLVPIHSFYAIWGGNALNRNLRQDNQNNPAICFFDTILSGFSFEQKTLKSRVPGGVGE